MTTAREQLRPAVDPAHDFDWIGRECPSCGERMRPVPVPSGEVVLHCTPCRITAI